MSLAEKVGMHPERVGFGRKTVPMHTLCIVDFTRTIGGPYATVVMAGHPQQGNVSFDTKQIMGNMCSWMFPEKWALQMEIPLAHP